MTKIHYLYKDKQVYLSVYVTTVLALVANIWTNPDIYLIVQKKRNKAKIYFKRINNNNNIKGKLNIQEMIFQQRKSNQIRSRSRVN